MIRNAILLCLVCSGLAAPAAAHPVPFSYVDLRLQPKTIELSVVAHVFDLANDLGIAPPEVLLDPANVAVHADAMARLLGPRLYVVVDGRRLEGGWAAPEILTDRQSLRFRASYPVESMGAVETHAYMFPYDPVHQTFVNVYEDGSLAAQAILDRGNTAFAHFAGTRQGAMAVIRKFLPEGIHHILIGPDHLLFLVGLLLLGGSWRQLLIVVTAFTAAHSVTLSLAALNIVTPPASVIEPAIALSIVYVGADNLLMRGGRDVRAWIAFVFGFIHGFGFANVLREMELPRRALGWSLFSFNVGVEIGQLFVVGLVAWALAALRARSEVAGRRLAVVGSVVVIAAGTFWFVQRVFFA